MSYDIQIGNNLGNFGLLQHDIIFDNTGRTIKLTGVAKLEQDIQKILFTTRNYFYNTYGTQIESLIGTNLGLTVTKQNLGSQVANALSMLQYLQSAQAKYQVVDAAEMIYQVSEIQVDYLFELTNNQQDSTSFQVTIIVINAVGQTITVSRSISLD
jgi:hypothetical protein